MESYKRQTVFYLNSLPPVSIRGLPLDVDLNDPMFHVMATKWGAVLAQHSPICPGDLVFVLSSRDAEEKLFAEKTYDLRLDINESEYLNLRLSRTKSPKDWDVKESLSVDLPSGFRKFYCPTLDPASPSFSPYSIINSDPAHREAWKKEVAKREVLVSEQGVGSGSREQLVVSTSGEQVEEWGRGGMGSLVAAKAEGSEGVGLRDLEGSGTDGLSCATSRERQAASVGMRQDLSANVPRPSNSNDPFPSFEPSSSTGLISSLTTNPLVPLGIPSPLPRAFAIPSPPPTAHPPIKLLTSITAPHTTPLSLDIRSELPKPSHSTQLPPAAETNLTRRGEDQNERPAPSSSSTSCRDCSQDHEYDPKHQTKDRRRPREHSMDTSLVRSRSKERSGHRSYSKDHSSHRSRRDRAHGEPAEQTHTSNFDSRPSSSNRDYDYSHHDSPYYDSPHDDLHTSRSRHLSLSSHQSSPGNDKPSRRRSRSPEPRREGRREDVSSSRRYPERAERNDRPSLGSQGSSYANRMAVHDETSEAAEDGIDIRISERHVPVQAGPKGTPITFDMAGVSLRGSKMYWMSEVGVRAAMRNSGTFSSHEGLQLRRIHVLPTNEKIGVVSLEFRSRAAKDEAMEESKALRKWIQVQNLHN